MQTQFIDLRGFERENEASRAILFPHRVYGLTLPLRNGTQKRTVVFNTLRYSDKELQSSFSKNVWPF